ncbi:hypothetical protein GNI_060890 [Gregarina niphandrodes]|uniref:Uncharacterized protein n=1 Tax=Gregarina niphandrodes TaxID=110365 RepID=A0A023B8F6_GRENI|nr:hypothetical protein GNI_060890 [Gregarina niphandrodes]EZG68909.1 hypothetical protein GNI_060890 [Gregarina niphandrodes]|eukprot:XP_011134533.1 hypothetical protein GNI_060890 [Gregarina niphandrodes]
MKCLRGVKVPSGAKAQALARVIVTINVYGKWVDMVKAFESLALTDDDASSGDADYEKDGARLLVDACKILKGMPDMVIGLENVEHVDLPYEELRTLHQGVHAEKNLLWNLLRSITGCLDAFAQVARLETCELPSELKGRLHDWMERMKNPYCRVFQETEAGRIQDLKFGFSELVRCPIKNWLKTCSIPSYEPEVHPDPDAWTKAETALNRVMPTTRIVEAYRTKNGAWDAEPMRGIYEEIHHLLD